MNRCFHPAISAIITVAFLTGCGSRSVSVAPDARVAADSHVASDLQTGLDLPVVINWISAGLHHTCGIRKGGSVACWGLNSDGQSSPPSGPFDEIAGGGYHTCACWGRNKEGQAPSKVD